MPVKKTESTTSWENYEGPRTNQPTKVHIQTCLTRDFSTSTREICHGSSRSDPREIRTSRVTRSVASRVGSGQQAFKSRGRIGSSQEVFKSHGSGRVRRFPNLTGRVGVGQEVLKSRASGRVGSGGFKISRVGQDV